MHHYIRISYASTTNSQPSSIRQDLTDILNEAQQHNAIHGICGVLFYGNDYFFQCLEGEKQVVDALYAKIAKDPRHKNIVTLSYDSIKEPRFNSWNLKYVLQEDTVLEFFQQHQWEKFNPYTLNEDLLEPFLNLLVTHNESTVGEKEVVVGREVVRGSTIHYKYAVFIVILVLALLLGLYFLSVFNVNTSFYGLPVQ